MIRRGARTWLRVMLSCPYSLSLSAACRARCSGSRARCASSASTPASSRPCDGPPPEPGIITVGPSTPLRATARSRRSRRVVPSPRRTLEALRTFEPDVVHLHEPLVARADHAALVGTDDPDRRHVPLGARRPQRLVRDVPPAAAADDAPARGVAPRCRRTRARQVDADVRRRLRDRAQRRRGRPTSPQAGVAAAPAPAILFVGRHEPRKGLAVLLDAFAGLDRDAVLWVAGDGPADRRAARPRACPTSSGSGGSPTTRRRRGSGARPIACAPSLDGESFGVVLLEAMAAGTALVASDIDGYRDVARARPRGAARPAGRRRRAARRAAHAPRRRRRGATRWSPAGRRAGRRVLDDAPRRAVPRRSTSGRSARAPGARSAPVGPYRIASASAR